MSHPKSARRLTLVAAVCLAAAAFGCGKPETEAAARARETQQLGDALGAWRVTLYRVAKTALRAAPPRGSVVALAAGRATMTREDWQAALDGDDALRPHRKRVGLFVASNALRDGVHAAVLVSLAVLAAKGGGRLAGGLDPIVVSLPSTPHPFGKPPDPAAFFRECKDLLQDDEDRYPTLLRGVWRVSKEALEEAPPGDALRRLYEHLGLPAFEHLVLGCGWEAARFPDLALYELERARPDGLLAAEELLLRAARTVRYREGKWHYHALDELAAFDARVPEAARMLAGLHPDAPNAKKLELGMAGVAHHLRADVYKDQKRDAEANRELDVARAALAGTQDAGFLAPALRCLAAKELLDRNRFKEAAAELRGAADLLLDDPKLQAELRESAATMERELPANLSPGELGRFAGRLLVRELSGGAVDASARDLVRSAREKVGEQLEAWEKSFPSTDALRDKARALWERRDSGKSSPIEGAPK